MEKDALLAKRDTDFVRDNMLINYCLGDDERLLIESFIVNNDLDIRFDVSHFYFAILGTHKKFLPLYTPQTFDIGVSNALRQYKVFERLMHERGYDGNVFLIKVDNSKQFGVLFSPQDGALCTPQEMAQEMHDIHAQCKETPHRSPIAHLYDSSSFAGPYRGYEQIHTAFLHARALNDLIFFGVKDRLITEAFRRETARPCDVGAVYTNCRRLMNAVCGGTCQQALRHASYIINKLIAPSYSMACFDALYSFCEGMLEMLETVYARQVRFSHRPKEDFLFLSAYHTYLCDALRTTFAQLRDAPRYSPTILMALSCIHHTYTHDLSLSQLSEYVYANPSTLSSDFNAEVGVSLSEYITGLRIARAQALLRETDASIRDIAQQSGFSGVKYFREIFKKQTGLSPLVYRKRGL